MKFFMFVNDLKQCCDTPKADCTLCIGQGPVNTIELCGIIMKTGVLFVTNIKIS